MYKSYPTRKTMPSRMARKHDRQRIFIANYKATALRKKARRKANQNLVSYS